jgi:hypothetical protein
MKWINFVLTGLALCCAPLANAAAPYSNSLTGFSGNSTQPATQAAVTGAGLTFFSTAGLNDNGTPADPSDDSNDTVVFDASGAHFGSLIPGDAGRNYMRTSISDYATVDFTAEITFEANDNQAVFFGIGTGDRALFGTPDWSTQFSSASFWPELNNDKYVQFKTANDVNAFVDKSVPDFAPGTHRFRMTFDAVTGFLVGSIDTNYAGGAFVADTISTVPIATKAGASPLFAPDGWPSEPSRIFFGGDDGAVFRDLTITVIPEPSSAVLLLLAISACVLRCSARSSR